MKISKYVLLFCLVMGATRMSAEELGSAGSLIAVSRPWMFHAESHAISQGVVSKVVGNATETMMDTFYRAQGWSKLPGEVGPHGIDGLYVKYRRGHIHQVLISDSKYGSSQLSQTKHGQQMTSEWIRQKLDNLIAASSAKTPPDEVLINQYKNIQRMIEGDAGVRRTLMRADFEGSKLVFKFEDLIEKNGRITVETRPVRSGGTGSSVFEIDLTSIPKVGPERQAFDAWINSVEKEMRQKGVPGNVASKKIAELKTDLESGKLQGRKAVRARLSEINTVTPGQIYTAALGRWACIGLGDIVITTGSLWLRKELAREILLREYTSIATSVFAASAVEFIMIQTSKTTGPAGWVAGGTYIVSRIVVVEAWNAIEKKQLAIQESLCQVAESRSRWRNYMTILSDIDSELDEVAKYYTPTLSGGPS